jgi:hypothetical protein
MPPEAETKKGRAKEKPGAAAPAPAAGKPAAAPAKSSRKVAEQPSLLPPNFETFDKPADPTPPGSNGKKAPKRS